MDSRNDRDREVELLAQRIEQLRELQHSQKHLPFVGVHLQEHIEELQARIDAILRFRTAS